jgi:hypothetical protein
MKIRMLDAQASMAFAISQATYVEREVYRIQYPDIQYQSLVPIDTSAPEWIKSVTYFSMDRAGQAKWINAGAKDIPLAELVRDRFETPVELAAIGYAWNIEEISQASYLGINLGTEKGEAARRVAEEMIDAIAITGDTQKGFEGLVNNSNVNAAAAADGASTFSDWPRKTPAEILFDVNDAVSDVQIDSNTVETANTLLLPYARFNYIASTLLGTASDTTILQFLRENNVYTATTRQELDIRAVRGLETAGAGGLDSTMRMVAYRKDPGVVKMHIPMPFRFLPVWQDGPLHFEVPGIFRVGGVDVRRPGAFRYRDGI